jgi:gas vesicle protein
MSNTSGNSLLALLTGALIGAGIGILYAPDKGTKTREKIKDGFQDAKDDLKNKLNNSKDNLEDSFEDMVSNVSHKTEDLILFLEQKLAELKEQNAKLQK